VANLVLDFEKPIIELENKINEMREMSDELELGEQITILENKVDDLKLQVYRNLTRWQRVQIARHPDRPITSNYIESCFDDFIELHGDRKFRDDPAIIGGMATFEGKPVM